MKNMSPLRHLSVLSAWALAFGCAVGSDSFVMPWTTCLPKAGPLGTILGILAGGLLMVIIAWNYHFMMNRYPGPGGAYDYAMEAFGGDHGFLCGWFLGFTYVGIVWLDATALVIIARYALGDFFRFGFKYMVGGFDVCFGDIVLPAIGIVIAALICCRRRLSGLMQTVLAVAFAAGILVCFLAAAFSHTGGVQTMGAAFMPGIGSPFSQIMHIVIISTWLFVGFESISNSSSEFRFPLKKAFAVMVAAIGTSVLAYVLLTLIPVLVPGEAYADWTKSILHVGDPISTLSTWPAVRWARWGVRSWA